jgi:hypothetical protein
MGAWLSPVVLAALADRVVAGDAGLPTLVATLALAPLIALLLAQSAPDEGRRVSRVADVAILIALTLILGANLLVLGDFARCLGFGRLHGIAAGVLLTLVVVASPAADRCWRWAMPVGTLLVVLPLGVVIASAGAPWTVWAGIASRPSLTFDARSAWITRDRVFGERTILTFDEVHRVVAGAPATWRVIERDAPRVVVREWTLGAGDALTLRPGDQFAIEAGARVRFETGRRIPNSPASGVAWADGRTSPTRVTPLAALGIVVTLVGGALALWGHRSGREHPSGRAEGRVPARLVVAPVLVLAFVLGATAWGLYGIALAPELAVVPRALAPLVEVTARLETASWRPSYAAVLAGGVIALFLGVAFAWRTRLGELFHAGSAAPRGAPPSPALLAGVTALIITLASTLAVQGGDPWQWFVWALGLAASAAAAPRLAQAGPRGELVGALCGGIAFGAAAAAVSFVPVDVRPFLEQPAVLAAPLGWATARLARSTSSIGGHGPSRSSSTVMDGQGSSP